MNNHEIRNKILHYIYDYQALHMKFLRNQKQDPGHSHVFFNQLEKDLELSSKEIDTNIKWLKRQEEVEYIEFEERYWGYGLTEKGIARISEAYNDDAERDRKLSRKLSSSTIGKNWVWILVTILTVSIPIISKWVFNFDLWNWIKSIFNSQ